MACWVCVPALSWGRHGNAAFIPLCLVWTLIKDLNLHIPYSIKLRRAPPMAGGIDFGMKLNIWGKREELDQ